MPFRRLTETKAVDSFLSRPELCRYCMNARELDNAEGVRVPCPGCFSSVAPRVNAKQALELAIQAVTRDQGKRKEVA